MVGPLDGVFVVALEQAVAAPFATRQLADLGAEVLKVERRGEGDFARGYDTAMGGTSAFFVWANRGKQSIELDLKNADDRATFDDLIAGADVFIQNLSPSAAGRMGILADQLRVARPELIACDISGYGLGGPRTDDKAYDLAIQAEGGAIALTGTPDQANKVGFSIADISSAMYAFSSILAALYRKQATGEGASIEVSMLESLAEWTAAPTYNAVGNGLVPSRSGHRHTMIAPYGLYGLADGSDVLVGVQSNRDWAAFAEHVLQDSSLIDDVRFADNVDRITNISELESIIDAVFMASSAEEVLGRLRAGRVTHSQVRDPLALWQHEQLRARERFMDVRTPTGSAEVYRSPFNISGVGDPAGHVPALGEDNSDLVARLLDRGSGQPKAHRVDSSTSCCEPSDMSDSSGDFSADIEGQAETDSSGLGSRAIARGLATLLLIAFAVTFALQNSETVEVSFLAWDFSMSKILLMIVSAVVGVLLWWLLSRLRKRNKTS